MRIKQILGLIFIVLLLVVVSKYFFSENIQINRVVTLLKEDKNQQVYVGEKLSNSSNEIIDSLLNLGESIADYSSRDSSHPIYISVRGDKNYLKFKLYKDDLSQGYVNDEYWTYFFNEEKKRYFYIGQIHLDIFLSDKERLKINKHNERLKKLKIIKNKNLQDWKVHLVIGIIFGLIFILLYDAVFRENHFDVKVKKRYWILFQVSFSIYILLMMKVFLG